MRALYVTILKRKAGAVAEMEVAMVVEALVMGKVAADVTGLNR